MKNIFRFSKCATKPTKVSKPVVGLTAIEWADARSHMADKYNDAKKRQRSANAKPSDFMRGLEYAMNIMDSYAPHIIGEVQL